MSYRHKIIFFITHHTLSEDHARMTLSSLSRSHNPMRFHRMYIYNTHPEEISNEFLLNLTREYKLSEIIDDITLFPGPYPQMKTLASDIKVIQAYCQRQYKPNDAIWLLKSDCVVSVNLMDEMKKVDKLNSFVLTPPFICAKKRVTDPEIIEYCSKSLYVPSDHETFFNEDAYATPENDHRNRPGESPTDSNIKFIACTCKRDFSCHYLTLDNLINVYKNEQDWGGCWFQGVADKWIGTYRGFIVHKYHNIVSASRAKPREGTIEEYMLS